MTIAIVLLARPIVARLAGTNWAYALWGVLLVPPLAAFVPSTITDSIRIWNYPSLGVSETDAIQIVLLGLWIVGVLAIGSVSIWRSIQVRHRVKGSFAPLSVGQLLQVEQSCSRANVFPAPKTVLSSYCGSPAVMNGLVPTLVLPDDFFWKYSPSERNLILHHELVHLRRFDLVWNVMFRSLRCLLGLSPSSNIASGFFGLIRRGPVTILSCVMSLATAAPTTHEPCTRRSFHRRVPQELRAFEIPVTN